METPEAAQTVREATMPNMVEAAVAVRLLQTSPMKVAQAEVLYSAQEPVGQERGRENQAATAGSGVPTLTRII